MSSQTKFICLIALFAIAISMNQDVLAKQSGSLCAEITTDHGDETVVDKSSANTGGSEESEPSVTVEASDSTKVPEERESPKVPELGTFACDVSCPKCDKVSKDESGQPEAQTLREKDRTSAKKGKKSSKKFRVITISIPVEPEGSDEVVGQERVETVDSDPEGPIAVDDAELEQNTTPTTTEEEVVEVTKSKKKATMKTKLEKKRSKRETKGKIFKEKDSATKVKSEKKSKKGKNKK